MGKQRLLLIVEAMGGGVRRHVVELIQGLDKDKFEIMLFYGQGRSDSTFELCAPKLSTIATLKGSSNLVREIDINMDKKALKEIKATIKDFKPDIVHCHSSKAGVLGRHAAKKLGVKKIFYTPHAYSFQAEEFSSKKKFLFVKIERWFSKRATTMTFNVSNGEKDVAVKNNIDNDEKFKVIYNGIPDYDRSENNPIRDELGLNNDCLIVGVTARLNEQKDPLTFAKIANEVIKENNKVHFVYVGDGPLFDQVNQYVVDNNLESNVHLLGFRENAGCLIQCFDLFLLTSLYEGMPYCLIESLCAGVPMAATKAVGNDEVIIEGLSGELFEISNVNHGKEVVSYMLANKDKYSYDKIRQDFEDRFHVNKMIGSMQDVYLSKH